MGGQVGNGARLGLEGALFVDATGTGTLGHLAGADYAYGWEGREAYAEPLQPEEPSDEVMGNTIYYRAVSRACPGVRQATVGGRVPLPP